MRPHCSLLQISRTGAWVQASFPGTKAARYSSIEALQSSLSQDLTSRPKNYIFDYLSPTPSHLLNITLSDFLPESCQPSSFSRTSLELPATNSDCSNGIPLPQGHHLVYFPPQVPSSSLLADGTDHLQSPGSPFDRRMWAGGSLHFDPQTSNQLLLSNDRVYCAESMTNVVVRGKDRDEKIFVKIKREIGRSLPKKMVNHAKSEIIMNAEEIGNNYIFAPSLVEERNLVYFRQKPPATTKEELDRPGKILKRTFSPLCIICIYYAYTNIT